MTNEEREFLKTQGDNRQWYLYLPEHRAMIDALVKEQYLQPTGAFKMQAGDGSVANIVGHDLPIIGELVSLYQLTHAGKLALDEPSPSD